MSQEGSAVNRQRPRAFRLDNAASSPELGRAVTTPVVEWQPDPYANEGRAAGLPADEAAVEDAQRRGMASRVRLTWGGVFWGAAGALTSLMLGMWFDRLIADLFARSEALGWVAAALGALVVVSLLGLATREVLGVLRQTQVAKLHAALAAARLEDDRELARKELQVLCGLYAARRSTATARAEVARAISEIIDGRDLIDLAEHTLMAPIDQRVAREIADAAKRVSLVTAISPRAVLDLVFVVAQLIRLIRRIAELYSGKPGLLGFLRLARSVGAHLAVTGGMAVGDSLLQQVVGHGIAAKLSARLGEGVLNGLLTTRVGLSAMAVCRPMPFGAVPQPGVKDVAPFLFSGKTEPP